MHVGRLPITPGLVCFTLCLFPVTPGHTLLVITGLPTSQGNTIILTILDHFSKAVHFVALPKLPTARETSNFLVQLFFCLHGIPLNIVSDRGPQFISQVWKAFCHVLGATLSLSSGFHPQSNVLEHPSHLD